MTLVCYSGQKGTRLYLIPLELTIPYHDCHGVLLNYNEEDLAPGIANKTEHLAYMLGEEPWYDQDGIPSLTDFLNRVSVDQEIANPDESEPCSAPWNKYLVDGPLVDFSNVTRIINCGWLV